MNLGVFQRKFK